MRSLQLCLISSFLPSFHSLQKHLLFLLCVHSVDCQITSHYKISQEPHFSNLNYVFITFCHHPHFIFIWLKVSDLQNFIIVYFQVFLFKVFFFFVVSHMGLNLDYLISYEANNLCSCFNMITVYHLTICVKRENWAPVGKAVMFIEQGCDNLKGEHIIVNTNVTVFSKQVNYELLSLTCYRKNITTLQSRMGKLKWKT